MKTNEAPERIWIDPASDLPKLIGHIDKDSVEYTRTDVFIEKIQNELDNLYHKWFDDSIGMEVSEEGAEIGALDMAYEAFQEIINNLKNKK